MQKYLTSRYKWRLLLFIISMVFVFTRCELAAIEGEAALAGTEIAGAGAELSAGEAATFARAFATDASSELVVANTDAANSILGKIRLEKTYGEPPKLYYEGKPEPIAEVYSKSGKIKWLHNGELYPIPNTIFSVEGEVVNIRSGALRSSNIVTTVRHGQLLVKLEESNGWYKVRLVKDGKLYYGWIKGAYAAPLILAAASKKMTLSTPPIKPLLNSKTQSVLECLKDRTSEFISPNLFTNTEQWPRLSNTNYRCFFTFDGYEIDNFVDRMNYSLVSIQSLNKIDFTISTKCRALNGDNVKGFGIIFGYIDQNNFYVFNIAPNGYYEVSRLMNNRWTSIIPWTVSDKILTGDQFNVLTIEKCASSLLFVINFSAVNAIDDFYSSSQYFGLAVEGKRSVYFQRASVSKNLF